MPDVPRHGALLSDDEFFAALDLARPGLRGVPAALAAGDIRAARRLFAEDVRHTLEPERLFSLGRTFRGTSFMYPNESVPEAAERILRHELISCATPHQFGETVDWFANPTFNQYREWTWQLNRHPEWGLLAEQYRASGDERYAAGFVELFSSWVGQALAPALDVPGNQTLAWRTIEMGIRQSGAWPWALHSFVRSPHVTDDVLVDWGKSIYEHARRLQRNHWTHNWLIMEMNGLAQISIFYPQFRDAPHWRQFAFDHLVAELDRQLYPDGLQFELSTNYHQVNIRNYQAVWEVCRAYDVPLPDAIRAGLERMHAANIALMMPDGRLPDLNDGRWLPLAPVAQAALAVNPERGDFQWVASGGAHGNPPAYTSFAFENSGYIVFRTGWQRDAVWVLFDGGPFGYAHQHEDKLNLLLHAYGRLLLTEGGNYAYDDSEMRRYVLSTRSHNTIRVDGQDQNRRLRFRGDGHGAVGAGTLVEGLSTPSGATWQTGGVVEMAEALYDEGYGPLAIRSARHRRRVLFFRHGVAGTGPLLLVVDRLEALDGAAHSYQALWHFEAEQARVDGLGVAGMDEHAPNLVILVAPLPGIDLVLVSGQERPEWQGWKSTGDAQQGEFAPAPTAIYSWKAAGSVRLVTLVYPVPPGQSCPIVALEADSSVESTSVRLRFRDGACFDLEESVS